MIHRAETAGTDGPNQEAGGGHLSVEAVFATRSGNPGQHAHAVGEEQTDSANDADNPKAQAIAAHDSQGGLGDFIGRFVHKDEIFWAETFLGEEGYILERAEADGEFVELATLEANTHSYMDGSASLTQAYRYRVKAFSATEESLYSDEAIYDPVSVEEIPGGPGGFFVPNDL